MTKTGSAARRRPFGAELVEGGTSFRVWAPERAAVALAIEGGATHPLSREADGYFGATVPGIGAGTRYRFRLDDDPALYPDPASRFQPEGPHGPSQVVDPEAFVWREDGWRGVALADAVISEMHVGTFTPEGTWAAAAERLAHLAAVGITVVEMMPVADFAGRFGWGYDGVDLFAPTRLYGEPDDLRRFIEAAHAHGIAVILDVVYNHLGPDGNYLAQFAPAYFTARYETEWGAAINFDGPGSAEVRRFFVGNAAYWIEEYRFDGFRLDATQSIYDDSRRHVIAELADAARAAAPGRNLILIGENEPQDTRLVRAPDAGGMGLDALWNDDLHHSAMVALTGRAEAYYEDHEGTPQEFISAAKHGYLFQGQLYFHQGKPRGRPGLDLPASAFVTFIQNHDQIANSDTGLPLARLVHPASLRAMTALILLMPGTPMLFQGQEFGATTPFHYFADHGEDLARLVREGRVESMSQFPSVEADAGIRARFPDPADPDTFHRSKLDWTEVERNVETLAFHRDLLTLRRADRILSGRGRLGVDGSMIGPAAFLLRYFGEGDDDRLILVNLGRDLLRRSISDPLVAPPTGRCWERLFSSEDAAYSGHGTPVVEGPNGWHIPAHATIILKSST